ncbi:hypothetical protein VitviT2T_002528 [Vitis vinifera]|uniref:Malic enzyme NAD-binding domain-containing protein n=1 Tax=Vitis vinifera TaxID=29760 RepID=A0ABY9BIR9_VITVI|nr:hypothetical protein VitviT2T_002528 [Vitis vinifera]
MLLPQQLYVHFFIYILRNTFPICELFSPLQGTTSVVLAELIASLKLVGGSLAELTFLFLGAGEAGTGIAELIALEISKQTKAPLEETRKKIWLVNSKGLIVHSRMESLQHFKKPWAHEHEPIRALVDAVQSIKPTVLIGSLGIGKTFTKEVVEAMTSFNFLTLLICAGFGLLERTLNHYANVRSSFWEINLIVG